nr:uncharacterized protein LOC117852021 isoform X2 [Setaria viridis]
MRRPSGGVLPQPQRSPLLLLSQASRFATCRVTTTPASGVVWGPSFSGSKLQCEAHHSSSTGDCDLLCGNQDHVFDGSHKSSPSRFSLYTWRLDMKFDYLIWDKKRVQLHEILSLRIYVVRDMMI